MATSSTTFVQPILLVNLILVSLTFLACSHGSNDLNVYKALDEGFINSNKIIQRENELIYMSLNQKLSDPATAAKVALWYPKATAIGAYSKEMNIYIDSLKSDLKKEAGLKAEEGRGSFRENDKSAVYRLFDKKGKGEEVYQKLNKYEESIMAVDTELKNEFHNSVILVTKSFDTIDKKLQNLTESFFKHIPAVAALAMLSQIQNNVEVNENKIIRFFNGKIGSYVERFDVYSVIIAESSKYARQGEEIEITAGVGGFSLAVHPQITVNGNSMPVNATGAAVYKLKVSNKPGKHHIPVTVSYTDMGGKRQTIDKQLEYTVIKNDKD